MSSCGNQSMQSLRIGALGAARIVPLALLTPAREVPDVRISAIAARDMARAKTFATKHGIARSHASYEALLADPDVDAVYIALPNGLHGRWTIAALRAGKHVLCEKPFTANAEEAEAVRDAARGSGLVCMEAFHYRYHALTRRLLEIIDSGEVGEVGRIETSFCIPLLAFKNIRWDLSLAGGALMDVGCYAIHLLRTLAGAEPTVRSAMAKTLKPDIDRYVRAEVEFADGRTGAITASMLSAKLLSASARVIGSKGTLDVSNPIMPQYHHRIRVRSASGTRKETVERQPSSYAAQLRAFSGAVRHGAPFPTHVDDAVANMRVIDACYRAAGLPRREPTRSSE
jgi:predicted dehydrogenase